MGQGQPLSPTAAGNSGPKSGVASKARARRLYTVLYDILAVPALGPHSNRPYTGWRPLPQLWPYGRRRRHAGLGLGDGRIESSVPAMVLPSLGSDLVIRAPQGCDVRRVGPSFPSGILAKDPARHRGRGVAPNARSRDLPWISANRSVAGVQIGAVEARRRTRVVRL